MMYEAWRISFQSSEQAARSAYAENMSLRRQLAECEAERDELEWVPLATRMPNPETHLRVLIFTDGHDFNGEQVFDVKAETLNECFYDDPDDQPEVCRFATHWMPIPALAKLGADKKGEES